MPIDRVLLRGPSHLEVPSVPLPLISDVSFENLGKVFFSFSTYA